MPRRESTSESAASKPPETASVTGEAKTPVVFPPPIDATAVLQRVAARVAARQPVLDVIAAQGAERALEVALWPLDRGWPARRLQEAWVVWRHGPMRVADRGSGDAGPLASEDLDRLRRAVARYERHVDARPDGFPAGGLAALATIAAIAAARDVKPLTLHYGIRLLDQTSKRMRASATVGDRGRLQRQAKRARRRRERLAIVTPEMERSATTWLAAPWPFWVALDELGDPVVVDGRLQLDGIYGSFAPRRSDPEFALTERDAQLLAGWEPVTGRDVMAAGDASHAGLYKRRARPGPYHPDPGLRGPRDAADVELARLAGISLVDAKRLPIDERDRVLEQLRAGASYRDARDRAEWWERFSDAANEDTDPPAPRQQ